MSRFVKLTAERLLLLATENTFTDKMPEIKISLLFLISAIALVAGASTRAKAQSEPKTPEIISPLLVSKDDNGVNLMTGKIEQRLPTLTIPAAPRLSTSRVTDFQPYIMANIVVSVRSLIETASFAIHLGSQKSESFQCKDYECKASDGSDAELVYGNNFSEKKMQARYTSSTNGVSYNFDLQSIYNYTPPDPIFAKDGNIQAMVHASTIQYSDGERQTISYDTLSIGNGRMIYRPNSVTDNNGYSLGFYYLGNDTYSNDWNSLISAKIFRGDNLDNALKSLNYAYSADGTVSITENGSSGAGRTFQVSGCGCFLVGGIEVSGGYLTLPSMSSATRAITKHANQNLISSVSNDGRSWSYEYVDVQPFQYSLDSYLYSSIKITNPDNKIKTFKFDNKWNVYTGIRAKNIISYNDENNITTDYAYDSINRLISVSNANGGIISVKYDERGNISEKRYKSLPSQPLSDIVETANYDLNTCVSSINSVNCHRPIWFRDGRQNQTDFIYNSRGQIELKTDPADTNGTRRRTATTYASSPSGISRISKISICGYHPTNSNLSTCGTAAEWIKEYEYLGDTLLPVVEREIAAGETLVTLRTYDPAGRLLSLDPPRAGNADATYRRYDTLGRLEWEIGGSGSDGVRLAQRYYYRDSDDQIASIDRGSVSSPDSSVLTVFERTAMTYNAERKPVRVLRSGDGSSIVTDASFDLVGRPLCTAVRMDPLQWGGQTDACVPQLNGPKGPDRITRNEYDAAGQLLKVYRAYGTPLQQVYAAFQYSPNGKRTSVTDANGNRAEMRYDGFDRQSAWHFPSKVTAGAASTDDYEAYEYDASGNRTTLRRRDGRQLTFEYDALNRMTVKRVPKGCAPIQSGGCPDGSATRDVYYGYDLRGLQTYARFDDVPGESVTNAYDGLGRLTSSTTAMAGTSRTVTAEYDAGGNRTLLTTARGSWTYTYDAASRMTGLYEGVGTDTVMSKWEYNAQGLPKTVTERFGSGASWGYDGSGRLTDQNDTFAGGTGNVAVKLGYNPASQIVSRSRSNNDYAFAGQYAVNRSYGVNGLNQYTGAGPATFSYDANGNLIADGRNAYVYDAENRLVKAGDTALAYDPLGRLFQVSGSSGPSQFLYDGDQLVAEYDGSGSLTNAYVHGPGDDDPLLWYPAGGAARWYHRDHQGSIVATASGPSGTLADINTYDEYGIPVANNGGRFQYTGQAFIPELGMYHYKARIYSPTLGRFLQTDPIGYDDQVNLYAYVANDPVNGRDPTGTETVGQYFEGVWSDIKDFGSAIAHGDFEYALGGLPPTLGGGVVSEGLAGARAVAAVRTEVSASTRAAQVHSVLDPIAQGRRTTAVLDTTKGRIVAGGGRDLTPTQRAALRPGESAARAFGAHAEATALRQAAASGATPRSLAASRPICSSCAAEIRNNGGRLTSPTTATFENSKPWWRFW